MTDTTPGYWSTEAVNARNAARLEPRQAIAALDEIIGADDDYLTELRAMHSPEPTWTGVECSICIDPEESFQDHFGHQAWPCEPLRVALHYTGIEIPEVLR